MDVKDWVAVYAAVLSTGNAAYQWWSARSKGRTRLQLQIDVVDHEDRNGRPFEGFRLRVRNRSAFEVRIEEVALLTDDGFVNAFEMELENPPETSRFAYTVASRKATDLNFYNPYREVIAAWDCRIPLVVRVTTEMGDVFRSDLSHAPPAVLGRLLLRAWRWLEKQSLEEDQRSLPPR